MADSPFDREVINKNERPISSDVNEVGSYADLALRELLLNLMAGRNSLNDDSRKILPVANTAAFLGAGFKARATSQPTGGSLAVSLDPGLGWFNDNTPVSGLGSPVVSGGVNDLSVLKPLSLTATETIAIPAADPSHGRVDLIEVQVDRRFMDPTSRDILNVTTGAFVPNSVNKTLSYNQNGRSTVNGVGSINYKTGTPAISPTAPAVDPGYVAVAYVGVTTNATFVQQSDIVDLRTPLDFHGILHVGFSFIYNGAGTGQAQKPQMLSIAAPPGVQIGVVSQPGAPSSAEIFIIAGAAGPGGAQGVCNVSMWDLNLNPYLAVGTSGFDGDVGLNLGLDLNLTKINITAANRTQLAGAASANPIQVAVGQPAYWGLLNLFGVTANSAPRAGVVVEMTAKIPLT